MSVQVKGSGTIGGLDEGLVVSGIVTSSTQVNVGSNIKLGNAGVVTATSFVGSGANLTSLPSQITFNNAAADRVLTSNGGTAVNAEANLTMTGNNLQFNTTANGHAVILKSTGNYYNKLSFDSGNTSAGGELAYIDFKWDGDKVADIYVEAGSDTTNKDDGHLVFRTSPQQGNIAERLRIDSSGDVTIKNHSAGGGLILDSRDSTSNYSLITGNANRASADYILTGIRGDWNSDSVAAIYLKTGADNTNKDDGEITFHTQTSGTNTLSERVRIDSDGSLHIASAGSRTNLSNNADDIVIGNTSTSNETGISIFSTSASGIRFNDASGTDGAIEYGHSARELRFNAAGANRLQFGINASNSPVFSLGTGHYSGDGNNHNKGDRASVKVGAYLHLESALGAGHNSRAGLGYNCYFHSLEDFYCGSRSPSSGDNRPAAYGMAYGNHYFYSDASNTAHSAQASLTMTKNMIIHRQGYVTKPNTVAFRATHAGHQSLSTGDTITTWSTTNSLRGHATGGASISSGVFTAPVTGVYVFHAQFLLMGASNTTSIHLVWKKNNTTFTYFNSRYNGNQIGYGGYVPVCGQTTMHLDANENCRITISFGGTAPSVYGTDSNWGFWDGYLLG